MSIWFIVNHINKSLEQISDLDQQTFKEALNQSDFLIFLKEREYASQNTNDIIVDLKNLIKKTPITRNSPFVRLFKVSESGGIHTLSFKKDDLSLDHFNEFSSSNDILYLLTPYHLKNGETSLRQEVIDILNSKANKFDLVTIILIVILLLGLVFLLY
jgi:hypothetical protein